MPDSRRTGRHGSDNATGSFFPKSHEADSTFVLFMFYLRNDRPTRELAHAHPQQMEKLAAEAAPKAANPAVAPDAPLPAEYGNLC
jgi:hypothetical protein